MLLRFIKFNIQNGVRTRMLRYKDLDRLHTFITKLMWETPYDKQ